MTGHICKYAPAAVLDGFGVPHRRLNPQVQDFTLSDSVTHQNICSFAKALINHVLEVGAKELLLTNCCDSIRRASDVLRRFASLDYLYLLDLPKCVNGCSKALYAKEIEKFIADYAAYSGREFSPQLACQALRGAAPPEAQAHVAVMGARMSSRQLAAMQAQSPYPLRNETCTAAVDIACPQTFSGAKEFAAWYADALLAQNGCLRMADTSVRRSITQHPQLKGIVYHTVKFCDYYPFEYARLDTSGIKHVKIETDYTAQSMGQVSARAAAFFESLNSGEGRRSMNKAGKYVVGIDSGSSSTDIAILDRSGQLLAGCVVPTGAKAGESSARALDQTLAQHGIDRQDIAAITATGYGRDNLHLDCGSVTEISCHARGARHLNPQVRTVIDIGGQDSKIICLDEDGRVQHFVMNDKCAAGTGRFLEMMAGVLQLSLDEMSRRGLACKEKITISSMCSVFAESEVVSLIAQNKNTDDIIYALSQSVAAKTMALLRRAKGTGGFMMTGGVSKNRSVASAIERALGEPLYITEQAQLCGAIGAALYALE